MITKFPKIVWDGNTSYELLLSYINYGTANNPDYRWVVQYFNMIEGEDRTVPRVMGANLLDEDLNSPRLGDLEEKVLPLLKEYGY